ncbi:unnamed protein product [Peniophora sp. CBMAI 1063]|nr:unnamed protein product [Peniophora sp. CBMAI 1063]
MSDIALDTATLLALFLESLLYGVFGALFVVTVVQQRKTKDTLRSRWIVPVSGMMLTVATAHLLLAFVRAQRGFTIAVHTAAGARGFFENVSAPMHVAMDSLYVVQTTVGDAVLIWRLYMVYARNVWVAIPFLVMLLANLATGIVVCCYEGLATPGSTIFGTASKWIKAFFILTMCMNAMCTAGILWRIWSHTRKRDIWSRDHEQGGLIWVLVIVAESGMLYSSAVLALFIAYVKGSQGQYVAVDLIMPLVGIIFVLIILQTHFKLYRSNAVQSVSHPRPLSLHSDRPLSRLPAGDSSFYPRQSTKDDHAMHKIAVRVTHDTVVNCPGGMCALRHPADAGCATVPADDKNPKTTVPYYGTSSSW